MNITILNQIIILFGLIALGYLIGKVKILDADANTKLSSFLLKVSLPATIINSALTQNSLSRSDVIPITLVAIFVFILVPIYSKIVAKLFHWPSTYELMLVYPNLGFMGFPIIGSVFGSDSVFYAAIFMMVFNVHIFTYGIMTLQRNRTNLKNLLKKLCTPGIIAAVVAYLLVLFPIQTVPAPVSGIISSLSAVTTPLAMIVIGSQLAQVSLLESIRNKQLYIMTVFKLAVNPLLVYFVLSLFLHGSIMVKIAAILSGLPVAGNVTMLCSEYKGNVNLAAQGTCVTTLLSLISVPIMLMLI